MMNERDALHAAHEALRRLYDAAWKHDPAWAAKSIDVIRAGATAAQVRDALRVRE